jgi:hypothetical protein
LAGITDMHHHAQLILLRWGFTNFLPRLASNSLPDLHFQSRWDYTTTYGFQCFIHLKIAIFPKSKWRTMTSLITVGKDVVSRDNK